MFSVIIPLYNKETTIKRTVKSVLVQTYQKFEIIVVNDGSTDQSVQVLETIMDSRLRIISYNNAGVSAARNRGITEAKYDLIAFLDADDEWLPEFLETIQQLVSFHPQCTVYGTRYLFGMPNGRTQACLIRGLNDRFFGVLEDYFNIAAKSDPPINSSAVVVKKTAVNAIGGFPEGIKSGEDLLTWARLACIGKVAYAMKPCAIFHLIPAHVYREKPTREPDPSDYVGRALKKLLAECQAADTKELKSYIALWHKMRASIYLQLNRRVKCYREVFQGLMFNPCQIKLYIYVLLTLLPETVVIKIFQKRWNYT